MIAGGTLVSALCLLGCLPVRISLLPVEGATEVYDARLVPAFDLNELELELHPAPFLPVPTLAPVSLNAGTSGRSLSEPLSLKSSR